jgi:hypothetical protein
VEQIETTRMNRLMKRKKGLHHHTPLFDLLYTPSTEKSFSALKPKYRLFTLYLSDDGMLHPIDLLYTPSMPSIFRHFFLSSKCTHTLPNICAAPCYYRRRICHLTPGMKQKRRSGVGWL